MQNNFLKCVCVKLFQKRIMQMQFFLFFYKFIFRDGEGFSNSQLNLKNTPYIGINNFFKSQTHFPNVFVTCNVQSVWMGSFYMYKLPKMK